MTNPDPVFPEPKKLNFGPFFAVLSVVILLGVAMFCTYLIVKGVIDSQTAALHLSEVKNSVGTCKALITLDNAHRGIVFPNINQAHPSERALTKLFAGIHDVVVASKCHALLNAVQKYGVQGTANRFFK